MVYAKAREVNVKHSRKKSIAGLTFGLAAMLTIAGPSSFGAEQAAVPSDTDLERTRQQVKMLDDLFKNAIVLIDETYVKKPSDVAAARASKALFANEKSWVV